MWTADIRWTLFAPNVRRRFLWTFRSNSTLADKFMQNNFCGTSDVNGMKVLYGILSRDSVQLCGGVDGYSNEAFKYHMVSPRRCAS